MEPVKTKDSQAVDDQSADLLTHGELCVLQGARPAKPEAKEHHSASFRRMNHL
jgi:hypothetical protein